MSTEYNTQRVEVQAADPILSWWTVRERASQACQQMDCIVDSEQYVKFKSGKSELGNSTLNWSIQGNKEILDIWEIWKFFMEFGCV